MLNSFKINNWDIYNNENTLNFQYEVNSNVYSLRYIKDSIEIGTVKRLNVPENVYSFNLVFDESKFSKLYDFYGIKLIFSDRSIQSKLLYSSYVSWDLNSTPYVSVPRSELESGVSIKTSYKFKPGTVLFNIYPIVQSSNTSEIESVEFGFKHL